MQECQHVKANGGTCEAAAMRGQSYCYFHLASRDRIHRQRVAARRKLALQIPNLEDAETIQLAITDTVNALLADRIDSRKAALVLYALQTAASNVKQTSFAKETNSFRQYNPERDPGLPELEDQEEQDEQEQDESPEKKPAAAVDTVEVIDEIHACADDRYPVSSSRPLRRALLKAANKALAQVAPPASLRRSSPRRTTNSISSS